jgi:hypothetical protein
MLAEKFMLMLETLRTAADRSQAYADGEPRVVSTGRRSRGSGSEFRPAVLEA